MQPPFDNLNSTCANNANNSMSILSTWIVIK